MSYEYLVVPAPRTAPRVKGVRGAAERFALAVAEVMNEAGRDGWEYLRTDTLPMEARAGWLGGRAVTPQELLVFRRAPSSDALPDDGAPAAPGAPSVPRAAGRGAAAGRDAAAGRRPAAGRSATGMLGAAVAGEDGEDGAEHRLPQRAEPAPVMPLSSPAAPRPQTASRPQGATGPGEHRVGLSPFDPARAEVEPLAPGSGQGAPGPGRPRLGGARRD